ncbi:MAG: hypothetical protein RL468_377 [Pseudomonadota bacterium]|jgi:carbon-monoxide dehydrogenase small subunit
MNGTPDRMTLPTEVSLTVNGQCLSAQVQARTHLADLLRASLGLNGTRLGCELGQCGACTVSLNGQSVRSCLTLAVQAQGASVLTIEGMADDPIGRVLQDCFIEHHAMQCGYCTAGMIISAHELLQEHPMPTGEQVRERLSGNYCRCTGYEAIVVAVLAAAKRLAGVGP